MSASGPNQASDEADLSVCAQERIQIPGSIESHGALLVAHNPELRIVQATANTESVLGYPVEDVLRTTLAHLLEDSSFHRLQAEILQRVLDANPYRLLGVHLKAREHAFDLTVHRLQGLLIVEFEPRTHDESHDPQDSYKVLTNTLADLRGAPSLANLCQRAAEHVRRMTGFDRVMIYRFLEDDSGMVLGESRREDLSPYLGLHFPASDIPPQARQLYTLNPIRLKPDVNAPASALVPVINPVTHESLDMSYCILRRMSPVHDEYLRNMGVTASMSLSILKGQQLWGLIACHHGKPKFVTHSNRIACEFLADFLSSQIVAKDDAEAWGYHNRLAAGQNRIEELLRSHGLRKTLAEYPDQVLSALDADGVAIHANRNLALVGVTPAANDIEKLVEWLSATQNEMVFATNNLSREYEAARSFVEAGSGLLSIRITRSSPDFVLWFRPELTQIVNWAGNPSKPAEITEQGRRISPRLSFEVWKQTVAGQSRPWNVLERHSAAALGHLMAEAMLTERNEEIDRLNQELARSNIELASFAYAASHDLQEPMRTIGAYAQLLQRRDTLRIDPFASESLQLIVDATKRTADLIKGLLEYSRLGGHERVQRTTMSLEDTLRWVTLNLSSAIQECDATITHGPLPHVKADPARIGQVLQNLIANSIRYRSSDRPIIRVSAENRDTQWLIRVEDNGRGFDPKYAHEIFEVFRRLHGNELSGSGLGLAICRRIIEQHGGTIEADSTPGAGSVFSFSLPES